MLKAVLFDFNGVIINDEPLHERLIEQLLIEENLRPREGEFRAFCLGKSDRACLRDLLDNRGRVVSDSYLDDLIARKAKAYADMLGSLEELPIYLGVSDLISKLQAQDCKLAIVSGALRSEIELVLGRSHLLDAFTVIVSGDELATSKPDPAGYQLAVDRLANEFTHLQLQPSDCLAIEDTFAGIQAAKSAGISVVGVANSYPFHMMQRCSNWAVDYLSDLELDRLEHFFKTESAPGDG
jgi:HAD superfamily hydrolase (TIGR01509 family)